MRLNRVPSWPGIAFIATFSIFTARAAATMAPTPLLISIPTGSSLVSIWTVKSAASSPQMNEVMNRRMTRPAIFSSLVSPKSSAPANEPSRMMGSSQGAVEASARASATPLAVLAEMGSGIVLSYRLLP
ncbi:hypothetical protein D3C75_841400 [compost metagenome]